MTGLNDATITKSGDNLTIRIFNDEHTAEITMEGNKKKATLKIRVIETHNLKVKKEVGTLNIYFSSICKRAVKKLLEIILDPKEFINLNSVCIGNRYNLIIQ